MFAWLSSTATYGQLQFEKEPIDYYKGELNDPVSKLIRKLEAGQTKLEFDDKHGYLPSLLKVLGVRPSSQTLVFSKTSFQLRRISGRTPRALYFSDDVYVGCVQDGDVLEISSVDPNQGAIFYTLSVEDTEQPVFLRDKGQCLICHASSRTQGVPGHVVRSVFADRAGQPQYGSGTFTTDHTSPFLERWGGWFVSGKHGSLRHLGNAFVEDKRRPERLDLEAGANLTDLSELVDVSPYLRPTSDIVALMVLEHQTQMHNFITLANYEHRTAYHYQQTINEALERPADFVDDSTRRRIASATEKLVEYLLFSGEFRWDAKVSGVSGFDKEFTELGPRDSKGLALLDFDLQTRLMKYPCSYLIYSDAFAHLPQEVKHLVYRRLWEVLSGKDKTKPFEHLTDEDRTAIREILWETKPDLAAFWKTLEGA